MTSHIEDLRLVLGKLQAAGFTLHGSKCSFGTDTITHLGFKYSSSGVAPFLEKTGITICVCVNCVADSLYSRQIRPYYKKHFQKPGGPHSMAVPCLSWSLILAS